MNKVFLTLAAAALAVSARAQSEALALQAGAFEASAAAAIAPFAAQDVFAGVPECAVVDEHAMHAWSLADAQTQLAPCLDAVGGRLGAKLQAQPGFVTAATNGQPAQVGLLIEADLASGCAADRALASSISRRNGVLLDQPVRLLADGDHAPESVSAPVQRTIDRCMVIDVVRSIRNGTDFLHIYGQCLSADASLGIRSLTAGDGLAVALTTAQTSPTAVDALNGYVTVNAGEGPVQVMITASAAQ